MAETHPTTTRERQPISVPFVWEHVPGIPKHDWKPTPPRLNTPVAPPPVKLVVSVPFGGEEKPGTPLVSFLQQQQTQRESSQCSIVVSPPFSQNSDQSYGEKKDYLGEIGMFESSSFETHDSFSSARSNTNPFLSGVDDDVTEQVLSSSDSETESYVTRNGSLAGQSFLEWLFPLLVPNSSEQKPNEVECLEKQNGNVPMRELLQENNCSQVRRPLLTLGELIVMSRRRSCQRKITKLQKQTSMDFMKRNALGCCVFGSGNRIGMLPLKLKRTLQLKQM